MTPTFRHYNPYEVVGVPVNQGFSFSGQLKGTFPQAKQNVELSKNYKLVEQKDAADPTPPITSIGVDVSTIPLGVNNQEISAINFTFDMVETKTARLEMGSAGAFSIPDDIVARPASN